MRVLIQRVSRAGLRIDGEPGPAIGLGLLVLVGITDEDSDEDALWISGKIARLRIFPDAEGVMNLSLADVQGEALVVSQFTLYASTQKGNRPSYIRAARPEKAIPLYEKVVCLLGSALGKPVATGRFGSDMQIDLVNDGPVTIWIDSKNRE